MDSIFITKVKNKIFSLILPNLKKIKDLCFESNYYNFTKELKIKSLQDGKCVENPVVVVLMNVGSPKSPTYFSLFSYLRQFLSDKRVIELPRCFWNVILYFVVLPFRSYTSAKLYRHIWTANGSPLIHFSKMQTIGVQNYFDQLYDSGKINRKVIVCYGMGYGNPSVTSALNFVKSLGPKQLLLFPLFPHSSGATVGSAFDSVAAEFKTWRYIPSLRFISGFSENDIYIKNIAKLIRKAWLEEEKSTNDQAENQNEEKMKCEKLIVSFHGLPVSFVKSGDRYAEFCNNTYLLLRQELNLSEDECIIAYQSRFGYNEWLQPYLSDILRDLANKGILSVDVVCPGFVSDCLETLHEICDEYRELFEEYTNGAGKLRYINCLNDSPEGIQTLTHILHENLTGWI